jgi:hypothetical protein
MRLINSAAQVWLQFLRAIRYWHFLNYSWHLAWIKARRSA